jgi:hypothetical protein
MSISGSGNTRLRSARQAPGRALGSGSTRPTPGWPGAHFRLRSGMRRHALHSHDASAR